MLFDVVNGEFRMGDRSKYHKDLHQQLYDKLTKMQAFGESKKEAVANGTSRDKIFSYNTYKTYYQHTKYFVKYVREKHPDCKTLKSAKKYANEWLESRVNQIDKNGNHLSAWTIQTEAKAIAKLYGITPESKNYFNPPQRHRYDIVRSRVDVVRDKNFSKTNNDELIKFCQGTGLRRSELQKIKGSDLVSKDQIERTITRLEQKTTKTDNDYKKLEILKDTRKFDSEYYIYVRNGKGGRQRISPIVGKHQDQIVERIRNTGMDERVWRHVNTNADIHSYRGDYATSIYKMTARDIKDIPYDAINKGSGKLYQSQVYVCRNDEAGKKLDKEAMLAASKALGHNRIEIVANNYIRGL